MNNLNQLRMYRFFLSCFCVLLLSLFVQAEENDSLDIALVLWRGVTQAERGFMGCFTAKSLPVRFSIFNCDKNLETLAKIKNKLKKNQPDLIYTFGTTVTTKLAGKYNNHPSEQFITDIPVVFAVVSDPVGAEIIAERDSLSRRNVTGVSHIVPIKSQLKAIRSVFPIQSIGALYNPKEKNAVLQIQQLTKLSIPEKYEVHIEALQVLKDGTVSMHNLKRSVARLLTVKPDIIYLPSDSYLISNAGIIVEQCHAAGIPTFSATEGPIRDDGAYMGLVSRYYMVGKFAGYKAQQILFHNRHPGEIPVERLKKFSFLINIDAAHTLDAYPPVPVLRFAEVISTLEKPDK